jgi:hypothetical protein
VSTAWTIAPGVSRVLAIVPLGENQYGPMPTNGDSSTVGQPSAAYVYTTGTGTTTPITGLTPGASYRIQVRARDAAGNSSDWSTEVIVTAPSSVSVPTVAATASVPAFGITGATTPPQSLFTTQVPVTTNVSEGVPVTIATTFVPTVGGTVTGGRFRAADNTGGTYQLVLFSVDSDDSPTATGTGTVLATATFGALTQSVYNTATFATPVSVQANTAYRIAVRTSEGRYSATNNFFATALVNGNLTAPQSNTSLTTIGPLENGNYCSGLTGYPNQSYQSSSYFVDPLFVATASGPTTVTLSPVVATASVPAPSVGGPPPTLVMGLNRPVVNSTSQVLDATITPAAGTSISTYLWEITAGLGSLTSASTASASYVAPSSGIGTATVRLTVTANDGKTAISTMTVAYGANIVAAENQLTGTARATWDLASPNLGGVATLQGFCDGFSVNKGSTANFKIAQSDAAGWSAEVYRLGYYSSLGARSFGTVTPTGPQLTASQAQPSPADIDPDTTLLSADCSGWSTTLTWTPPAWSPSGMYVLRLNRTGGGASHIMFVVRDDARRADVIVMPADSTWNAYNAWGGMGGSQYSGNSLYYGTAVDQYNGDCAHYVSYDRPVVNRGAADAGRAYGAVEWSNFFTAEYPMVRFLERNGIDAKYYSCLDAAGDSAGIQLIGNGSTRGGGKTAMMIGHNEYWNDGMRSGWDAASAAGVNIFTCASNEVFWRCVGTINDASSRPHVWECQKSTINGRGSTRPSWTGTWRDPDGIGKGGNNPENKLTGTIFAVNGPDLRSLVVPATGGFSAQPLWRHTSVATLTSGQSFTSGGQILGFEWDTYGPAGVSSAGGQFMAAPDPRTRYCSDATYAVSSLLLDDAGDVYTSGNATHRLVVKPGGGNGMVFGTGTMNWAFGCDDANVYQQGSDNTSSVIQQATVNMLVDMGAAPATLMSGLTAPTAVDWFVDAGMTTIVTTAGVTNFAITTGSNVNAVLLPVTATATVPSFGIVSATNLSTLTVAATATVPAFTAKASTTGALATVVAVATVPAQAVVAAASLSWSVVSAVATVPAQAITAASAVGWSVVSAVATIPAPALNSGLSGALAVVAATTAVPAVSASAGSRVTPAAVAGTAAAPSITASAASKAQPSTVTGVASVPILEIETGISIDVALAPVVAAAAIGSFSFQSVATAGLPTVQAVAAVALMGFQSAATSGLLTVQAVTAVGTPGFSSSATVAPLTVQATSSVVGPVFSGGTRVQLVGFSAEAEILSPGIVSGSATTVNLDSPDAVSLVPIPTIHAGAAATLVAVVGTTAVPALSVRLGVAPTLTVVSATAAVPVPQASAGAGSGVGLVTVVASAAVSVPQASAETGSGVGLAPVAATAVIPAAATRTGTLVSGQVVSGAASIPVFAVRVTLVVRPNAIVATVTIWQPSFGTSSQVQLVAVLARAAVPNARLLMVPLVFAYPHQVLIDRHRPYIVMKRRPG